MSKLEFIQKKIIQPENLDYLLSFWRFKQLKIVFTNGCFDMLHQGHIEYLLKASELGDLLIIGLNTDDSVKRLKGNDRPIHNEYSRALFLASLSFIDFVTLFNEDTPFNLIKTIQPDILVKGGDYEPENIVGYNIVKAKGGEVKTIKFVEGFSSTSLINKIKKQ